jgi:YidC/Oxa1 family membrane protein insertase
MRDVLRTWQNAKRFRGLPNERRSIVFYSEGSGYTKYFFPIITALIGNHGVTLAYLTSDPADPLLLSNDPRIDAFYIGTGSARTFVFQKLRARVLVMTELVSEI